MMLADKVPGLCITRQYPKRVKMVYKVKGAKIIWLSHTPGKDHHNPTALGALTKLICSFIEEKGECVVLLDGLEYLMINNGFNHVLTFLDHLNEFVMQSEGMVLLPVRPDALDERELALLERNLEVLEAVQLRAELGVREIGELIENY